MGYYCEIHTINNTNTLVRVCMNAVTVTKGFFRFKSVVNVAITSLSQNDNLLMLFFIDMPQINIKVSKNYSSADIEKAVYSSLFIFESLDRCA